PQTHRRHGPAPTRRAHADTPRSPSHALDQGFAAPQSPRPLRRASARPTRRPSIHRPPPNTNLRLGRPRRLRRPPPDKPRNPLARPAARARSPRPAPLALPGAISVAPKKATDRSLFEIRRRTEPNDDEGARR